MQHAPSRLPAFFLTHGGGPMPVMGDPSQKGITNFLKKLSQNVPEPKALLVVSGHWEEKQATVSTAAAPPMYYDYYGFPPEAYQLQYPAPGSPELARQALALLREAGFKTAEDPKRGYDHGTFVPLMLVFPKADVPVVQLSLLNSMDAQAHVDMGRALAPLREEGVMLVGSGSSFHNMQAFRSSGFGRAAASGDADNPSKEFDDWLQDVVTSPAYSPEQRLTRLAGWAAAPGARYAHPREEHLLPIMVAAGAARGVAGRTVQSDVVMSAHLSSFQWD